MKQLLLIALFYILTWVHFTHCQDRIDVLTTEFKLLRNATLKEMADFKQKQNETQEVLKGYGDLQQKINDILAKLSGMQEKQEHVESKLQEMQENQGHIKGKLQEMQEKLQHVEINLQEFHHELEHMKGAVNSNQDSLQNISAKLETLEDVDECAQGKHDCSPLATCRSYSCSCNPPSEGNGDSCSCPPGFAEKGSNCEDIDECTEGKAECSPQATCRNSVGSYSCSCNPPFEGDGRTCEFTCRSPDKVFEGLGCVKFVGEWKTFEEMNATCHRAGGRLLQDFNVERLQEVVRTFGIYGVLGRWVGVREGKWLESGLPLQEELWEESSRGSDPSGRSGLCGAIYLDFSSSLYKVGQLDCSEKTWGYCQILIPQK